METLSRYPRIRAVLDANRDDWPAPVIDVFPADGRWDHLAMQRALVEGEPSIHFDPWPDRIRINTHWLRDEDIDPIIRRWAEVSNSI